MVSFTNNTFHNSQILLSDKVVRYASWSSHAIFGSAIALSLATFIPSHCSSKLVNAALCPILFVVSNRLDRLAMYASGYGSITEAQSHVSYRNWLDASLAPPRREVAIAPPDPLPAPPLALSDIKKALSKPHVLVLGETGAGKSTLVKFLVSHAAAPSIVLDSHAAPDDWQGMNVIGMGRNYPAIGEAVEQLVAFMDARYQARSQGQKQFEPLLVLIDEFPAAAANLGKSFTDNIMLLVREARKVSIRLIILSQGSEVKNLGIEGQGSIRECFAIISIGKFASDRAKSLKDAQIKQFIESAKYPAMLDDLPCQLPQIDRVNLPDLPLPRDYQDLIATSNQLAIGPELQSELAPVFSKVLNFLDGRDWTRDNYIKQSITEFKNADTPIEEVQGYLQFLEVQGHLETRGAGRNGLEARKI